MNTTDESKHQRHLLHVYLFLPEPRAYILKVTSAKGEEFKSTAIAVLHLYQHLSSILQNSIRPKRKCRGVFSKRSNHHRMILEMAENIISTNLCAKDYVEFSRERHEKRTMETWCFKHVIGCYMFCWIFHCAGSRLRCSWFWDWGI